MLQRAVKGCVGYHAFDSVQTLLPQKLRLSACPCPVLGGHLAISNRAHLTADLSAELLAQQVVLSNEHGYTDTSAWLHTEVIKDSRNSPSPLKHLFFSFLWGGGVSRLPCILHRKSWFLVCLKANEVWVSWLPTFGGSSLVQRVWISARR